jgi:uncharacterized protein with HEPN domain
MHDPELLVDRLRTLLEALERIARRFSGIATAPDLTATDAGVDRTDAVCMTLIAVGEELKTIDRKTEGRPVTRYPDVGWRGVNRGAGHFGTRLLPGEP